MVEHNGRSDPGPAGPGGGPVNGFRILEQLSALPISTWRYQWEDPKVRHLGPMAQDWAATFGLGEDDTTIAMVDANGVALVAIQALYRLTEQLHQTVIALQEQVNALTRSAQVRVPQADPGAPQGPRSSR
jgi:hypothetical protein